MFLTNIYVKLTKHYRNEKLKNEVYNNKYLLILLVFQPKASFSSKNWNIICLFNSRFLSLQSLFLG